MALSFVQMNADIEAHGLRLRGVLDPGPGDNLPPLPSGEPARLWLVGAWGSSLWAPFQASPESADGLPAPLDRWSERLALGWAQTWGGLALFPFGGPPHWPFQRWASRAEPLTPSPLGLRLHPVAGLWHAYRFALLLPSNIEAPPESPSLANGDGACVGCARPCVSACPAGAHDHGFDLKRCTDHLRTSAGQTCLEQGCQARAACPEGREWVYEPEHMRFHMAAFARAHVDSSKG